MGKQDNLPNATELKSILEALNSMRPSFSCRSLSLGSGEDTKSVSFWLTPPGWRRHSWTCCCFAHAAAETMLLTTRHRSCHISNWPLFCPRPASRGRTNTNQTKQCADRFDNQDSEQMSARKDVPRMFDSIGANTHESKLRLFSRPPLPHSFAQALLRAQEATSSHFERNLARFGLTHVQQCGLALRIHTQDPRQTHQ